MSFSLTRLARSDYYLGNSFVIHGMSMAVSLRVPEEVKKRIDKLAKQQDVTPHGFMLEAIREKVEAEEARLAFHAEAPKSARRPRLDAAVLLGVLRALGPEALPSSHQLL